MMRSAKQIIDAPPLPAAMVCSACFVVRDRSQPSIILHRRFIETLCATLLLIVSYCKMISAANGSAESEKVFCDAFRTSFIFNRSFYKPMQYAAFIDNKVYKI